MQHQLTLAGGLRPPWGPSMSWIEGDGTSGLASLPSGFTNAVGTLGVDEGDDDLIAAKNYLDQADAPMAVVGVGAAFRSHVSGVAARTG